MVRNIVLWIIVSFAALAGLLYGLTHFWHGLGEGMSGHGWFAYVLGGVFTLALSFGLFSLTFFSARNGYDDIDTTDQSPD